MYIEPNSVIRIVKGCPLNNTYQHTIYFTDTISQFNYFADLTKYIITGHTFQRHTQNAVKVQKPIGDLYDCNYLLFTNPAFANKWFYAFITNVEYINNNTSIIYYQLDVMQSWFFDYELLPSFVIREHSESDVIGENTVPEGLEHGEYITTNEVFVGLGGLNVYLLATEIVEEVRQYAIEPQTLGGLPTPCYIFKLGVAQDFTNHVIDLIVNAYDKAGKGNAIVTIFTAPHNFVSTRADVRINNHIGATRTLSKKPKNNKLYCYPYCCNASVCGGTGIELRYELFNKHTPTFQSIGGFGANMTVAITPTNYSGNAFDIEHTIPLTNFPLLPWTNDYFQNWIAQNKASLIYGTVKDVGSFIGGAVQSFTPTRVPFTLGVTDSSNQVRWSGKQVGSYEFGNIGSGIGQMAESADSLINRGIEVYEHSIIPDNMQGSAQAGDIYAVSGKAGFYNYCRSIKPEYVDIIDGYFDKYGYKTNRTKIPNTHSREHWNYVQTGDCTIKGNLPQADIDIICSIYNTGITFWKNGNEVGNYNLDNTVKGGV